MWTDTSTLSVSQQAVSAWNTMTLHFGPAVVPAMNPGWHGVTLTLGGLDENGTPFSALVNLAADSVLVQRPPLLVYQPASNHPDTVTQGQTEFSDTVVVALTVIPVNDTPSVTSADADTATVDVAYQYIATATDSDDTPTISFENIPSFRRTPAAACRL